MIDLYYWTTPNGHKITMFLEETGLKYKIFPINIGKGDQFKAEFLAIAPNNRIPAMVDHEPKGGGKPISIFESGAMLLYLAETIRARPATERAYAKAKEVNPNFGQPAIRTDEERKILFGQTAAVVK